LRFSTIRSPSFTCRADACRTAACVVWRLPKRCALYGSGSPPLGARPVLHAAAVPVLPTRAR
jgi:hypothetical protein